MMYGWPFLVILMRRVDVSLRLPAVRAYDPDLRSRDDRRFLLVLLRVVRRLFVGALRVRFLRARVAAAIVPTIAPPATAPPIAVAIGFEANPPTSARIEAPTLCNPSVSFDIVIPRVRSYISLLVYDVHTDNRTPRIRLSSSRRRASGGSGLYFLTEHLSLRS